MKTDANFDPLKRKGKGAIFVVPCHTLKSENGATINAFQSKFHVTIEGAWNNTPGSAPKGMNKCTFRSSEGKPKGPLRDLYKDAQRGLFKVKLKGALEFPHKVTHVGAFVSAQECRN